MYANLINTNHSLSGSFSRALKAEAVGFGIKAITGEFPIIVTKPDYTQVNFTPTQIAGIANLLDKWSSTEPGDFRINATQVLTPYLIKKYGLYALGGALVFYLIGKIL